jgi:hypothetical protein
VPTGAPIFTDQGIVSADEDGVYTATMSMDMVVPTGTHWLSFRPELESGETLWYWALATTLTGDYAALRDAESLTTMGLCPEWTPATECFPGAPPDQPYIYELQFDILGVIGGDACN